METKVLIDGDKMTVGYSEDLSDVAAYTKGLHNAGEHGSKDLKLAGLVHPFMIYAYTAKRGITWAEFWEDNTHMKNLLNDPDNADFRVWKGRL